MSFQVFASLTTSIQAFKTCQTTANNSPSPETISFQDDWHLRYSTSVIRPISFAASGDMMYKSASCVPFDWHKWGLICVIMTDFCLIASRSLCCNQLFVITACACQRVLNEGVDSDLMRLCEGHCVRFIKIWHAWIVFDVKFVMSWETGAGLWSRWPSCVKMKWKDDAA